MLYFDVLQDICAQLNDPDMVSLKERAKDHFVRALSHLINEGHYTESDIPGYYKSVNLTPSVKGEVDISSYFVLKIVNYAINPSAVSTNGGEVIISPKTLEQLSRMNAVPSVRPSKYDLFIVRQGNLLLGYNNPGGSNFTFPTDSYTMIYIQDIDNSSWNDSEGVGGTNFQSATNYLFSFSFTRRAIERAVQTLLAEDKE